MPFNVFRVKYRVQTTISNKNCFKFSLNFNFSFKMNSSLKIKYFGPELLKILFLNLGLYIGLNTKSQSDVPLLNFQMKLWVPLKSF